MTRDIEHLAPTLLAFSLLVRCQAVFFAYVPVSRSKSRWILMVSPVHALTLMLYINTAISGTTCPATD